MKQAQRVFRVRKVTNYSGKVLWWAVTDAPEDSTDMSYPVFAKFPISDRFDEEKQRQNASVLANLCNGLLETQKTQKYEELRLRKEAKKLGEQRRVEALDELDQMADKNSKAHDEMMAALQKAGHVEKSEVKKPFWKRFFKE